MSRTATVARSFVTVPERLRDACPRAKYGAAACTQTPDLEPELWCVFCQAAGILDDTIAVGFQALSAFPWWRIQRANGRVLVSIGCYPAGHKWHRITCNQGVGETIPALIERTVIRAKRELERR